MAPASFRTQLRAVGLTGLVLLGGVRAASAHAAKKARVSSDAPARRPPARGRGTAGEFRHGRAAPSGRRTSVTERTREIGAAWQIFAYIVILIRSTVGMAWVAGRIYRVGILMYGKKPTIPEILRWVRYSPGKSLQPAGAVTPK